MKKADITPIFKKGDRLLKTNYRPVSILATLAKVYEKLLYPQIYDYFDRIFSKYLGGFRKGHSTQHCLLIMLEKLRGALDKGLVTGILLTDLSKAFDSISHELLAAKLYAYRFSNNSVKLIYDYLSGRTQRTKVNNSFSKLLEIMFGVPQGSILGVILFNIYIDDLFFSAEFQIANFADDCSPFDFGATTEDVIKKLEEQSELLIEWYRCNYLKPNPDKWHLILSKKGSSDFINIDGQKIFNSENEKVLGIYFDNKLNFEHHIGKLCKKASQKLHALGRVSSFMSFHEKKTIMNAFINSQFGYCPLIWMCHSRLANKQINKIHERALRIVFIDNDSNFEDLLKKSNSVSIHHRNLQHIAIEIYKALNGLSTTLMSELFKIKIRKYDFRSGNTIVSNNPHTTKYGLNTISYLAPKILEKVPYDTKSSESLNLFKNKIKSWIPIKCPCGLCRPYVHNVGFI